MSRRASLNRALFDRGPLRAIGRRIHRRQCRRQTRAQSTATVLLRNLRQMEALEGPLHALVAPGRLRVLVAGCSCGQEAYGLGGYLAVRFPGLDWHIDAFDVCEGAVAVAQAGMYTAAQCAGGADGDLARRIRARLLQPAAEGVRIAGDIRARIAFAHGDVLAPDMAERRGYDLVLGQNFMIHMAVAEAARALSALVAATRSGGALMVAGMDLDARMSVLMETGLEQVTWEMAAIHDADHVRRSAWPWHYWALEPMDPDRPDGARRYATIFMKP